MEQNLIENLNNIQGMMENLKNSLSDLQNTITTTRGLINSPEKFRGELFNDPVTRDIIYDLVSGIVEEIIKREIDTLLNERLPDIINDRYSDIATAIDNRIDNYLSQDQVFSDRVKDIVSSSLVIDTNISMV